MPEYYRSVLRVEGKDDKYVIEKLLSRHGVDHSVVDIKWSGQGEDDSGGRDPLLDGMKLAVTTSTGKAVGSVLDADTAPEDRWRSVRSRLDDVGVALPAEIPQGGFVGEAPAYGRVCRTVLQSGHTISGTTVRPRLLSSSGSDAFSDPQGCEFWLFRRLPHGFRRSGTLVGAQRR